MTEVVGIIEQINSRDGAYGKMYSYKVNGSYYDAGRFPVRDVKEGDLVKVKYTTNERGYHKIDKGGMIKQEPQREQAGATGAATSGYAQRTTYQDPKQDIISKQAAENTAIALIDMMVRSGGFKFPANAKAADIFATLKQAVLTEAAELYKLNTGKEWVIDTEQAEKPAPRGRAADPAPEPDLVADDAGYDEYPN